jgi:hypothetical protein
VERRSINLVALWCSDAREGISRVQVILEPCTRAGLEALAPVGRGWPRKGEVMKRRVCLVGGLAVLGTALALLGTALLSGETDPAERGRPRLATAFMGPYLGSGVAYARIRREIISPQFVTPVTLPTEGGDLSVSGPVACDRGETVRVRAVVFQEATGAFGEGRWEGACMGDVQAWTATAALLGTAQYTPGAARGCAWATTSSAGGATDTHHWCEDLDLEEGA